MGNANINDRGSLERAYPQDAFAGDAAQNDQPQSAVIHGVSIGSAPDAHGRFALYRAARHVGEPEAPTFLAPAAGTDYQRFLDDIIAAAQRSGFRPEESPGPGDPRIRGARQ